MIHASAGLSAIDAKLPVTMPPNWHPAKMTTKEVSVMPKRSPKYLARSPGKIFSAIAFIASFSQC